MQVTMIPTVKKLERKKLVCAYARVSNSKDAMLHSLSNQVQYYKDYIMAHKKWIFTKVYYDEGISGTKNNRPAFKQMLQDARDGKFDIIITKSISRFARNTVTLLEAVRELKNYNVDVYFEEQRIHTLSSDGELILTILASYAQEEAKSVSDNMLWRVKKNFTEGRVYGGNSLLGYKLEKGKFIIVPSEAELVRRIFNLYLDGCGVCKIAKLLTDEGIRTYTGSKVWNREVIRVILSNIAYTGTLILQKTYKENHITKKYMRNKGEKPLYIVNDNHEPIISIETFNEVQRIKSLKAEKYHKISTGNLHAFVGLLYCGECGHYFRHKMLNKRDNWICSQYDDLGKEHCTSKKIREDVLKNACVEVLGIESFDEQKLRAKVERIEAFNGNRLVFYFKNGTTKEITWEHPSRSESWTKEMREEARRKEKERNGKSNNNTTNN